MKKLYTKGVLLLMLALFFNVTTSNAQSLDDIDFQFTAPCASLGFNDYEVELDWTPAFGADNEFILELSDSSGNFDNPVELDIITTASSPPITIVFDFEFPTNTAGKNYKVRVRTTNPVMISSESSEFQAYHVNIDEPLILNNFEDAVLCGGSPTLISVTNFPDETLYNWYKDNVLIVSEKGASLLVSSLGNYYVEVDYGDFCSGNTASNIITAIDGGMGSTETVSITSDVTESCNQAVDITFTSTITDSNYTYTWYKDDVALDETTPTLVANEEGIYFLEIIIGQCPIYSNDVVITECGDLPEPPEGTVIYNVLTPNGDGINDRWILPEIYTASEIEVIIYGATGEILHQVRGYDNNNPWPETTVSHIKNNPVFYYRILDGSEVLEQGSITLIK